MKDSMRAIRIIVQEVSCDEWKPVSLLFGCVNFQHCIVDGESFAPQTLALVGSAISNSECITDFVCHGDGSPFREPDLGAPADFSIIPGVAIDHPAEITRTINAAITAASINSVTDVAHNGVVERVALKLITEAVIDGTDAVKGCVKIVDKSVMAQFEQSGTTCQKIAGRTVSIAPDIWASAKPNQIEKLKAYGPTADFVRETVHVQTLSAWTREQLKLHGRENGKIVLPEELRDALSIRDEFKVSVRKS